VLALCGCSNNCRGRFYDRGYFKKVQEGMSMGFFVGLVGDIIRKEKPGVFHRAID